MASPTRGSGKRIEVSMAYLKGVEQVTLLNGSMEA